MSEDNFRTLVIGGIDVGEGVTSFYHTFTLMQELVDADDESIIRCDLGEYMSLKLEPVGIPYPNTAMSIFELMKEAYPEKEKLSIQEQKKAYREGLHKMNKKGKRW